MENLYNLTNPQKSIWLTEQYYKGSNINNICGSLTIKQPLDFEKFKQAIQLFVENNSSFRICLKMDNNEIKQYVKDFSLRTFFHSPSLPYIFHLGRKE